MPRNQRTKTVSYLRDYQSYFPPFYSIDRHLNLEKSRNSVAMIFSVIQFHICIKNSRPKMIHIVYILLALVCHQRLHILQDGQSDQETRRYYDERSCRGMVVTNRYARGLHANVIVKTVVSSDVPLAIPHRSVPRGSPRDLNNKCFF